MDLVIDLILFYYSKVIVEIFIKKFIGRINVLFFVFFFINKVLFIIVIIYYGKIW